MNTAKQRIHLPRNAVKIDGAKCDYIDKKGNIYNFGVNNPRGIIKKHKIDRNGYPAVNLNINGKRKTINIHALMANAFIEKGYSAKGRCCMHKDDNKLNCKLSNLEVGTYSKNNSDAYARGINKGRKKWI